MVTDSFCEDEWCETIVSDKWILMKEAVAAIITILIWISAGLWCLDLYDSDNCSEMTETHQTSLGVGFSYEEVFEMCQEMPQLPATNTQQLSFQAK